MASLDVAAIRRLTFAGLVVLGISSVFAQQLSSADPNDKETVELVSKMVPQFHLSRQKIGDEVSSKLLDGFIKDLDPQKLYFLASDIKGFETQRTSLDDAIHSGSIQFAYDVFNLYQKRLTHQMEVAHHWIDQEHDFSSEEYVETDGDKVEWSATQADLDDRWRRRVKYDLLQYKLDAERDAKDKTGEERTEAIEKALAEGRENLHKRYRNNLRVVEQYDDVEKMEMFLTAMTQCFDPHSTYMSPDSWEDFEINLRLSLDGIGAALRADDGYTVVAQIVPGGAAATDGRLQVGDRILGVGQGDGGEIVDIFEMKLSEVVRLIRGQRGTVVRLRVKSENSDETKIYDLTRQKIELKESEVKGEIIETQNRVGRKGRVGIISLPSFYRDFAGAQGGQDFKSAAADMAKVLERFAREGVDVVVVDLRNNGGGALTEAIEVSGHFIDRGPVVQVKEPSGYVRQLDDEESGVMYSGPLVVLCNRLSASASEIFAGVIKDYKRGIVIGDTTTHGKGTVQNLLDVAPRQPFRILRPTSRGKLKLTIQQFYRVNGDSTQNRGVRSDIVLPSLIDHWDLGESSLENALPFDQVKPADYPAGRYVSPKLIADLQTNSEHRVASDEDFNKLNRSIQRYLEKKNRTKFPLSESVVRQEREIDDKLNDALKDKSKEDEEEPAPGEGPIFPDSFYNDEVLKIALDYVDALNGQLTVQR